MNERMNVNCTQGLQFAPQISNPDLPSANPMIFQNVLSREQSYCGHGHGDHSAGGSPERRIQWLQQKINQLQRMISQLEGSDGTDTGNTGGLGNGSPLGGSSSADPTSSQDPIQQLQQEISSLQQEISILQQQIGSLQQQLANLQGGMQGPGGWQGLGGAQGPGGMYGPQGAGGQGPGGLQAYGGQGPYGAQGQGGLPGAQTCGDGGYQNPVQQLQQQIAGLQQEIAGLEQQLASLQQQLANLEGGQQPGGQQGPYGPQGPGGLQGGQTGANNGYQNQIQQLQQQLASLQQQLNSLQGPGSLQGQGCGPSGLSVNGNTVNTGRYTITASNDGGGTLTIVDNSTGKNIKIWGDPHITTDKGDTANFQHQPVTFALDDGTRITIDPTNNPGAVEYISRVAITKGNDAVEMSGLHQGTLQTQYEPGMGNAVRSQYAEGTEITPINGQLDQLQVVGGPMISGNSDPNLDSYASPTSSPARHNTYTNGQLTLQMQRLFSWSQHHHSTHWGHHVRTHNDI